MLTLLFALSYTFGVFYNTPARRDLTSVLSEGIVYFWLIDVHIMISNHPNDSVHFEMLICSAIKSSIVKFDLLTIKQI